MSTAATLEGFELSPLQRHLWRLGARPDAGPYRVRAVLSLESGVAAEAVRAALEGVVETSEILRTAFRSVPGLELSLQVPSSAGETGLDWRGSEPTPSGGVAEAFARLESDLSDERPLVALHLTRGAPGDPDRLLLSLPALAVDRHSLALLAERLDRALEGVTEAVDGADELQVADLAAWQQELLDAEETAAAREHWLRQDGLGEHLGHADGPFQPERLELDPDLVAPLLERRAGRDEADSWLLACWALVLGRHLGREHLALAVHVPGREIDELASMIGPVGRFLPLELDLDPTVSVERLARRARRAVGEAAAAAAAFDWPLVAAAPGTPVAPFAFEYQSFGSIAAGSRVVLEDTEAVIDRFAARLTLIEGAGPPRLSLSWDGSLFDRDRVERWAADLEATVGRAAAAPGRAVGSLETLAPAERRRLSVEENDTAVDLFAGEEGRTLDALVVTALDAARDRVVLTDGARSLDGAELLDRSAALAAELVARGVGADDPVAVAVGRSPELVVALLGVLRAGAAFVPVDPSHPPARIAALLEQAAPRAVVVAGGGDGDSLAPFAELPRIDLSRLEAGPGSAEAPLPGADPDQLAYVLYTSGSTGRPKGVEMPHRGIVNRLLWMRREHPLTPDDRVLQRTPPIFDASLWEIFLPLLCGARLVLAAADASADTAALARTVAEHGVSALQLVPSLLRPFLDEPEISRQAATVRLLCAGGEALTPALRDLCHERLSGVRLVNLYGPTETAIDATSWVTEPGRPGSGPGPGPVPIGRPLANLRAVLADRRLWPVPDGTAGELLVGGASLARGYRGRPGATAAVFVPDPSADDRGEPGARVYRTGDLARRRHDGALLYMGRIDRQVKLRGVRIEPGEVEAALAGAPGVAQAVVDLRGTAEDGVPRLVAWYLPAAGQTPGEREIRAHLVDRLPAALIPAALGAIDAIPRTVGGKVDRAALDDPASSSSGAAAGRRTAPRTPTEELLVELWAEVLDMDPPGVHESFFDLGGHSLQATRVVARLRRELGSELTVRELFQRPTVAALAARIDELARRSAGLEAPPFERVDRDGPLPISHAQRRLWFFDRMAPGSSLYNLPVAVAFRGELDRPALVRALGEIVRRHESLRTTFREDDTGEPMQVIAAPGAAVARLPLVDLTALGPDVGEAETRRLIEEEASTPFDLERGPLLRARLLERADGVHVGLLDLHHIVSDGWSTTVLIRELAVAYDAAVGGQPPSWPELEIQYADFATWQRAWLAGEVLERQIDYWRNALDGAPPLLELPTDRPRPPVETHRGSSITHLVPLEVVEPLREVARGASATLFMVLAAAGGAVLGWLADQDDLVLGTDTANRNRAETEGLIGFFINQLALRVRLGGDPTFGELLGRLRETTLGAYAHEDLPFDQLVTALNPERERSHAPVFQVKINLHNLPMPPLELTDVTLEPLQIERDTAQFDLIFNFIEDPRGLLASVDYATDLFEGATVRRILTLVETALRVVGESPEATIAQLATHLEERDRELRQAERERRRQSRSSGLGGRRGRRRDRGRDRGREESSS